MLTETQIEVRKIILAADGKIKREHNMMEDLAYLMLIVKYHMFDLDACKRELKDKI